MNRQSYNFDGRPAFILAGWDLDDGQCRILASRSVHDLDFEMRSSHRDLHLDPFLTRVITESRVILTAEMGKLDIIEAPHWRGILEAVHRNWAPRGVKPWE